MATIVNVNANNRAPLGLTSTPNVQNGANGYYSPYADSDSTFREGNNGLFSDERMTLPRHPA